MKRATILTMKKTKMMKKICNVCKQEKEHAGSRSTTCNDCLSKGKKYCSECHEVKLIEYFGKKGNTVNSCCKSCNVKRSKLTRRDEYYSEYYSDDSKVQRRREYGLEHYRKNKKAINKHRVEHNRERYHSDEEYRQKRIQQSRMYEATRTYSGHISAEEWLKVCLSFNNTCAYCGTTGPLTMDHIIPVSNGGKNTLGNVVPACRRCNSSKGAKNYREWYMNQTFFKVDRLIKIEEVMPNDA